MREYAEASSTKPQQFTAIERAHRVFDDAVRLAARVVELEDRLTGCGYGPTDGQLKATPIGLLNVLLDNGDRASSALAVAEVALDRINAALDA